MAHHYFVISKTWKTWRGEHNHGQRHGQGHVNLLRGEKRRAWESLHKELVGMSKVAADKLPLSHFKIRSRSPFWEREFVKDSKAPFPSYLHTYRTEFDGKDDMEFTPGPAIQRILCADCGMSVLIALFGEKSD